MTTPLTWSQRWNQFWFTPVDPTPLSVVRIATGLLLAYSQLVWAIGSDVFFGPNSWLNASAVNAIHQGSFATSPLWLIDSSPELLGLMHVTALISALCLSFGFMTRCAAMVSYSCILAYVHRNPAALYGFDQVIGFLTLYLAIGPSGARLSIDEFLTPMRQRIDHSVLANVSLRLIQLHLCILYFFAGVSKLKGATWWNGFALWGAIGNQEYQTIDLTWLAGFPLIINVLTHLSVWWEVSYAALIWNRHTRPMWLGMAVAVHLGIGLSFGMLTFGLAMLVANIAFVESRVWRELIGRMTRYNGGNSALLRSSLSHRC